MSMEVSRAYSPPADCTACRLGKVTVPSTPSDVRAIHLWDDDNEQWVKPYRLNVVQGDGPVPCPVMLIGEAPGFHEDRDGKGFRPHAPAGRVLDQVMHEVGLMRWNPDTAPAYLPEFSKNGWPWVYVTNALKCRPVDNKIDKFLDCLEVCRDTFLTREIAAVRPKVIVALGKVAAQPWFGKESSMAVRMLSKDSVMLGPVGVYEADGTMVIHAPHPSNIARGAAENRPKLVNALRLAKEVGYGA